MVQLYKICYRGKGVDQHILLEMYKQIYQDKSMVYYADKVPLKET